MTHYNNLGFDYINKNESFDNLLLIFDANELQWINCSENTMLKINKYFKYGENFIMGYYLKKKKGYNMIFYTKISYDDIINDIKENNLEKSIKIEFSKDDYEKLRKIKIHAENFDDAISNLIHKLNKLTIKVL